MLKCLHNIVNCVLPTCMQKSVREWCRPESTLKLCEFNVTILKVRTYVCAYMSLIVM